MTSLLRPSRVRQSGARAAAASGRSSHSLCVTNDLPTCMPSHQTPSMHVQGQPRLSSSHTQDVAPTTTAMLGPTIGRLEPGAVCVHLNAFHPYSTLEPRRCCRRSAPDPFSTPHDTFGHECTASSSHGSAEGAVGSKVGRPGEATPALPPRPASRQRCHLPCHRGQMQATGAPAACHAVAWPCVRRSSDVTWCRA